MELTERKNSCFEKNYSVSVGLLYVLTSLKLYSHTWLVCAGLYSDMTHLCGCIFLQANHTLTSSQYTCTHFFKVLGRNIVPSRTCHSFSVDSVGSYHLLQDSLFLTMNGVIVILQKIN